MGHDQFPHRDEADTRPFMVIAILRVRERREDM
jgi:hypothetical protein